MEKPKNFKSLDVKTLAKTHQHLKGETALTEFDRLISDHAGAVTGYAAWSVQGAMAPDQSGKPAVWLHLEAHATVPLTCQRCMGTVMQTLEVARDFRFVADEATAVAEDESSTEDVLVLEDSLNLMALIEDELLMSLPLVPMHTACLTAQAPISPEEQALVLEVKPNPFAALATLKTRKH